MQSCGRLWSGIRSALPASLAPDGKERRWHTESCIGSRAARTSSTRRPLRRYIRTAAGTFPTVKSSTRPGLQRTAGRSSQFTSRGKAGSASAITRLCHSSKPALRAASLRRLRKRLSRSKTNKRHSAPSPRSAKQVEVLERSLDDRPRYGPCAIGTNGHNRGTTSGDALLVETTKAPASGLFVSGRCWARTSDLLLVRQALSQLS